MSTESATTPAQRRRPRAISLDYWIDPDLRGTRCLAVDGPASSGPFVSARGAIGTMERGEQWLETPFSRSAIGVGDILWIPPDVLYRFRGVAGADVCCRILFINRERLRDWTSEALELVCDRTVSVIRDPALAARLVEAHKFSGSGILGQAAALRRVASSILWQVPDHAVGAVGWNLREPEPARGTSVSPAVRKARAMLDADPGQPLSVQALATACGISREHLTRAFKQTYWLTPHLWLTVARVRRAKNLLEAGWDIGAAAVECGFADQSHMHRWFRKILLVSPGVLAGVSATADDER